ncbi:hypothetical protein BT63DRAFT_1293 [Microthyrium microscopicum]|uniref:Apple domain-containing protein n=1 Tax=Microthyrium microscopicum TaxID=703497 RepID=A0A6A6UQN5_9PEZI|nr:hypothetical protein BT63DRAFT_1293 [Microthyrium microscopicum]
MLSLLGTVAALPLIFASPFDSADVIAKRAQVCGSAGYDKNTKAYFYDDKTLGSISACSAHCLADTKCLSYAVGSGECLHYTVAVTGNLATNAASPFAFYDRACVSSVSSSIRPSSSSIHPSSSSTRPSSSSIRPSSSSVRPSSTAAISSSSLTSSRTSTFLSSTRSSTTSSSTASTSASCSLRGYDLNKPESYIDSSNAAYRSATGCAAFCKAQSTCVSFAWSSSVCYLYAKPVVGNFKADASSPYRKISLCQNTQRIRWFPQNVSLVE